MTIITISRAATPDEVAAEMDRRGAVIERLETDLRAAQVWQPIDTLPHDGTPEDRENCGLWHGPVLVFVPDEFGGQICVAQCDGGHWIVLTGDHTFTELHPLPSHWMPLPAAPAKYKKAAHGDAGAAKSGRKRAPEPVAHRDGLTAQTNIATEIEAEWQR